MFCTLAKEQTSKQELQICNLWLPQVLLVKRCAAAAAAEQERLASVVALAPVQARLWIGAHPARNHKQTSVGDVHSRRRERKPKEKMVGSPSVRDLAKKGRMYS